MIETGSRMSKQNVGMNNVMKTLRRTRVFNVETSGQWNYLHREETELENRKQSDYYENEIIPLFKSENPTWESDLELRERVIELYEIVLNLRKPVDSGFVKTSSWDIDIYSLKYGEPSGHETIESLPVNYNEKHERHYLTNPSTQYKNHIRSFDCL
ncbi:hypothetical protein OAJ98_02255 [Deltaproteobacteria bacterium]|nr:hypothetical protein [Deltaproteobacteria bacterium]